MQGLRAFLAAALLVKLALQSAWRLAGPANPVLGTVITADKAHVGEGMADVGTTVFGGDRISTEAEGSVQTSRRSRAFAAAERQRRRSERHGRHALRKTFAGNRHFFDRQCARIHAVCFESRDPRAIRRADDRPSDLSQRQRIVGDQQARSTDRYRGWRNPSDRGRHFLSRVSSILPPTIARSAGRG